MKKIVLFTFAFASLLVVNAVNPNFRTEIPVVTPVGGFVKIVNDTKEDYRIHTGSGHVTLNHGGGSTSVACEAGRKISHSDGSKAKGLIFTIDESMCGKTVKLSDYL